VTSAYAGLVTAVVLFVFDASPRPDAGVVWGSIAALAAANILAGLSLGLRALPLPLLLLPVALAAGTVDADEDRISMVVPVVMYVLGPSFALVVLGVVVRAIARRL